MFILFLNIITFILTIVVNAFANILPLNGQTTGEISNKLDVLITPAGFTFSIWSLIYILCAIWIIRQIPSGRRQLDFYRKASPLFILSNLLNSAWIFVWHYEQFFASVIVMIALLLTLIALYITIKNEKHDLLDILPFSIYLGWISVATIVNISYYLKYIGWGGFALSDTVWTIIMLFIAAALALYFRYKEADWFYPLVFIWAFFGIGTKNLDDHQTLAYTAFALAAVILFLLPFLRKKNRNRW